MKNELKNIINKAEELALKYPFKQVKTLYNDYEWEAFCEKEWYESAYVNKNAHSVKINDRYVKIFFPGKTYKDQKEFNIVIRLNDDTETINNKDENIEITIDKRIEKSINVTHMF